MLLPTDTLPTDWDPENRSGWDNLLGALPAPYSKLEPLEAKALHVFGLLVRTFDAAGRLLWFNKDRPYGDYYLHAYLLACSTIELLARCRAGDEDLSRDSNIALKRGLADVGLDNIHVGLEGYVYDPDRLVALRNLAAHGQGAAIVHGKSVSVFLHVELLDHFPLYLMKAFDSYYDDIFTSTDPQARKQLAHSGVEPVLYSTGSGQVFISPIQYAYVEIYQETRKPSQVMQNMKHSDWQVYK